MQKKDGKRCFPSFLPLNRRLSVRNSLSIAHFPAISYTEHIKDVLTLQETEFCPYEY